MLVTPKHPKGPNIEKNKSRLECSISKLEQFKLVLEHFIDSVQTRCIVQGKAQESPLFWRFSGGF